MSSMQVLALLKKATSSTVIISRLDNRDSVLHLIWPLTEGKDNEITEENIPVSSH